MSQKLLYYDAQYEEACKLICHYLQITNLPSIDGQSYYTVTKETIKKQSLSRKHIIDKNTSIFNTDLIAKFKSNKHEVFFVFEENYLCGVVHISDYNKDAVLQHLQDDFLTFERKLRLLLTLNNFSNSDMRTHFEKRAQSTDPKKKELYQNKLKLYDFRKQEIDALGPFQTFDFSDILDFIEHHFSASNLSFSTKPIAGKKKATTKILRDLRNMAMHAKNPVSFDNTTSIYSTESLHEFLDSLAVFREYFSLITNIIRNHPIYSKSIELENRSKLEIIMNHHPKALEYFINA